MNLSLFQTRTRVSERGREREREREREGIRYLARKEGLIYIKYKYINKTINIYINIRSVKDS